MAISTHIGPVQVCDNGRYFIDQDGKPFFWLGDTQWELFRSFTFDDARTILKDRKSKGFSVIQAMITGFDDGSGANLAGQTPWINNDPKTPNEEYFKYIDSVIQSGCENELVFALGIFHQVQTSYITLANARIYAKWLARRYRNTPNIIWAMYPKAQQEFLPVVRELAAGLQEGDGGAHIVTVHPDPSPASSSFIHSEGWLDFNSIQTWKDVDLIYPMVTADYNLQPVKPVVMAEGVYEGGVEYGFEVTPLWIRRQAYYTYLAGGHHSYGHRTYTYLARGHHSHRHKDSYSGRALPTLKDALDAPGAIQMGILKRILLDQKEWWNLVPDQSVFTDCGNIGSPTARKEKKNRIMNVAACSATGEWVLAYLGSSITVTIEMGKISAGNMVKASWINPTTGARTAIGSFTNTGTRSFVTPGGWEDAVLLLEAWQEARS
jgi:hypothetical protein